MKIVNRTRASALALAVIGVLAASQANASGFQLRENSSKAMGRASAGSAVAKGDAAVVANNPAAMTNFDRLTVQGDVTVIDLTAEFSGGACTVISATVCRPVAGGNGGDPGDPTVVPAMAMVMPLTGAFEGLTLGASISAPFGLATKYDPTWVGRYNATTSEVKVPALNVSAAVKITDTLSAGVGLVYQRADVTLANAIDFGRLLGAIGVPGALPGSADGSVSISGADNGLGWTAGLQWRPSDRFAIGYSHRSEVDHVIQGDADFTVPASFVGVQPGLRTNATALATAIANLPAATPPATRAAMVAQYQQLLVLGNAFGDTSGTAKLTTPSIDTLSVEVGVTDAWRVYGEYQQTDWSSLRQVAIDFGNPYQPDSAEAFHWKNSKYYAIGTEFDLSPSFTLRAGIGKDESPTNDVDRTPRLPDNDRMLYAIGATWNAGEHLSLNAGYMRITFDTPTVHALSSSNSLLTGSFDGNANLFTVGAQYKF